MSITEVAKDLWGGGCNSEWSNPDVTQKEAEKYVIEMVLGIATNSHGVRVQLPAFKFHGEWRIAGIHVHELTNGPLMLDLKEEFKPLQKQAAGFLTDPKIYATVTQILQDSRSKKDLRQQLK